jgi:hypothetical protein
MKKLLTILLLFFLQNKVTYSQPQKMLQSILENGIWEADLGSYNNYRMQGHSIYFMYYKSKIFEIGYDKGKANSYNYKSLVYENYFFTSNEVFDIFMKKKFNQEFICKYISENKSKLLDDKQFKLGVEHHVISYSVNNDKTCNFAIAYDYRFDNEYLFGRTTSDPDDTDVLNHGMGLLLRKVKISSIPKDILTLVKKIQTVDFKTVVLSKIPIYKIPNQKTKMYLIKGDEVMVLQEKEEWLEIVYSGKKRVEGWVKKSDLD